jgi:hypothetical protein
MTRLDFSDLVKILEELRVKRLLAIPSSLSTNTDSFHSYLHAPIKFRGARTDPLLRTACLGTVPPVPSD